MQIQWNFQRAHCLDPRDLISHHSLAAAAFQLAQQAFQSQSHRHLLSASL
jgi:hypothetical protein